MASDGGSQDPRPGAEVALDRRYRVQGILVPGSQDAVYLAGRADGATVELRVLSGDLGRDDELAAALCAHGALLQSAASDCPGIASVYECGRPDASTVTVAAEHPDGPTLRDLIQREGRVEPARAVRLAIRIAEVLERVHSLGVVHGGLRPDNVTLTGSEEAVALTQVGFDWLVLQRASSRGVHPGMSSAGAAYRAPEQASGTATERSDVYADGAILYEMLAGVPPPDPGSPAAAGMARALRAHRPRIAPSLERTIARALDPVPAARQGDISVLCNDLWEEINSSPRHGKRSGGVGARRPGIGGWARQLVAGGAIAGVAGLAIWASAPRLPFRAAPLGVQAPPAQPVSEAPAPGPPAALPPLGPGAGVHGARVLSVPSLGSPDMEAASSPPPPSEPGRSPKVPSPEPLPVQRPGPRPSAPRPRAPTSDAAPPSVSPGAVRPPHPPAPAGRSALESPGTPGARSRRPSAEPVEDPAPIIDWLFTEGSRQRP